MCEKMRCTQQLSIYFKFEWVRPKMTECACLKKGLNSSLYLIQILEKWARPKMKGACVKYRGVNRGF